MSNFYKVRPTYLKPFLQPWRAEPCSLQRCERSSPSVEVNSPPVRVNSPSIGNTPPTSPAQHSYQATDKTPHLVEFEPEDVGKTAYYRLRWVNTRNETGPWSELASAMITG